MNEETRLILEGLAYLNQRVWLLERSVLGAEVTDTIGHAALQTCVEMLLKGGEDREVLESLWDTYIVPTIKTTENLNRYGQRKDI